MGNTLQITPFMHVRALGEAVAFFESLGFQATFRMEGYAYVEREGAAIRILEHGAPEEVAEGKRSFRYYIDVRDVDQVHRELASVLATLPEGHVLGPIDQPYRQRELLILAPDGELLVFGAAIMLESVRLAPLAAQATNPA